MASILGDKGVGQLHIQKSQSYPNLALSCLLMLVPFLFAYFLYLLALISVFLLAFYLTRSCE
jgi:hypothetical protein